jgi:hypothetical protein
MGSCFGISRTTERDAYSSVVSTEERERRAQAAQERIEKQQRRGVQKTGGQLQKKLEKEQKDGGTSSKADSILPPNQKADWN